MSRQAEHTRIVCSTHRRTRIKVSAKRKTESELRRIARKLEELPKVSKVATNLITGSIVVDHDKGALDTIQATLKDLGVILIAVEVGGEPQWLTDAVADLDRRIGLATNGRMNLRLLVPLGFGALAAVQLLRRGLEITGAPWYVLAFAAFESYVRLNPEEDESAECATGDL